MLLTKQNDEKDKTKENVYLMHVNLKVVYPRDNRSINDRKWIILSVPYTHDKCLLRACIVGIRGG